MATTKKTLKLGITKASLPRHLQRYIETKALADESATRLKKQRDELIAYVELRGIQDDKGHAWVESEGLRAKRERRVSNVFDADAAMEYLTEHGGDLYAECVEMVPIINEDELIAKIYEEVIPEDVATSWYTEKEVFVLKVEEIR